jgi:hypothetical protein
MSGCDSYGLTLSASCRVQRRTKPSRLARWTATRISHFWEAQGAYSVHKQGASQKKLTIICLPSDPYRKQIQGAHALTVTSRGE